jgi:hypothetical protein
MSGSNLPNIQGAIIATGYNCHVRVGESATDAEIIALVTSFQANEDFQVQDAVVIGNLGPVSIDPQGYTCSITLDSFLPAKRILEGEVQYTGGGKKAVMDHVPARAQFMTDGALPKIVYMDFYNKRDGIILASFQGVLVTSNGVSVEGNSYARNNVQMRALTWNKD